MTERKKESNPTHSTPGRRGEETVREGDQTGGQMPRQGRQPQVDRPIESQPKRQGPSEREIGERNIDESTGEGDFSLRREGRDQDL